MPLSSWQRELHIVLAVCLGLMCGCQSGPLSRMAIRGEREPVIEDSNNSSSVQSIDQKFNSNHAKPASKERKRPPSIAERLKLNGKDQPADPESDPRELAQSHDPPKDQSAVQELDNRSGSTQEIESNVQNSTGSKDNVPEIQLASVEPENDSTTPQSRESNTEQVSHETDNSPGDIEQAASQASDSTETETAADDDRWSMDAIKILPDRKRDGRTLTERLGAPRITPPWSSKDGSSDIPPYSRKKTERAPSVPKSTPVVTAPARTNPKTAFWQDELRGVISLMEAEAARPAEDNSPAEKQAHIQRQIYLRMMYLMAAEPEKAQLPLMDVDPVDQEFWSSMFWGMSNYFSDDPTIDLGVRASQTATQLQTAARHLQSIADLELRNVSLCQRIDGWGLYERYDRDEFEAGQAVLLYGELRNFHSEQTITGYRTVIHSTVEIVRAGEEQTVIEKLDLGEVEDLCKGLRTDFYNSYQINIPSNLTPGPYRLRLLIEDKLSGRMATQTMGFVVR